MGYVCLCTHWFRFLSCIFCRRLLCCKFHGVSISSMCCIAIINSPRLLAHFVGTSTLVSSFLFSSKIIEQWKVYLLFGFEVWTQPTIWDLLLNLHIQLSLLDHFLLFVHKFGWMYLWRYYKYLEPIFFIVTWHIKIWVQTSIVLMEHKSMKSWLRAIPIF